jgi:hypothetical protein
MTRRSRNVDPLGTLDVDGGLVPANPPSSAWHLIDAPADEDVGFDDEVGFLVDEEWPDHFGAAGLGIP